MSLIENSNAPQKTLCLQVFAVANLQTACEVLYRQDILTGDLVSIYAIGGRVKDQSQSLLFDLTDFLPFQMYVIANRAFHRIMEEAGLQVPEWRIMMALPAHQPCSSHDLCVLTAMDAARVSRAQRRLEDLDMISIIRDDNDRRRLVVRLSEKGAQEMSRLRGAAREVEAELLGQLGPEDRANLRTVVGDLYSNG